MINAGGGSEGFSITSKGNFVWSTDDGFGGWLGEYTGDQDVQG